MAKFFKCYNCESDKGTPGRDFAGEKPICPKCGLDGTDPHVAHLIVACRLIHFEAPHPIAKNRGSGQLACGADRKGAQVTGEISAANCPACLVSEAGKAAVAAKDAGDEFDMELLIDPKNQQYVKKE